MGFIDFSPSAAAANNAWHGGGGGGDAAGVRAYALSQTPEMGECCRVLLTTTSVRHWPNAQSSPVRACVHFVVRAHMKTALPEHIYLIEGSSFSSLQAPVRPKRFGHRMSFATVSQPHHYVACVRLFAGWNSNVPDAIYGFARQWERERSSMEWWSSCWQSVFVRPFSCGCFAIQLGAHLLRLVSVLHTWRNVGQARTLVKSECKSQLSFIVIVMALAFDCLQVCWRSFDWVNNRFEYKHGTFLWRPRFFCSVSLGLISYYVTGVEQVFSTWHILAERFHP